MMDKWKELVAIGACSDVFTIMPSRKPMIWHGAWSLGQGVKH